MRGTRSFTLVLIAIVGVALIATGYGVAQLTSVETEVRVVVRPHEDGRVEFAVQQRVDGEWGERIAPSSRYLTPALIESRAGRWLNSSPITLTVNVEGSSLAQADPAPPPNRAPIADAGTDGSYDLSERVIVLNGNQSSDPDGDSLTYEWTQVGGPMVSLSKGSASPAEARFDSPRQEQTLTFELRVADEAGASSTDQISLTFENTPPLADAGEDQTVSAGALVMLSAAGSTDADHSAITYVWTQTEGDPVNLNSPESVSPTFVAPARPQTLQFLLTVNDGLSNGTDTTAVNVESSFDPILASNWDAGLFSVPVVYRAERNNLTDRVRTDIRQWGIDSELILDIVCFESGVTGIGFWLLNYDTSDLPEGRRVTVTWRVNGEGEFESRIMRIEHVGDVPAIYFEFSPENSRLSHPEITSGEGNLLLFVAIRVGDDRIIDGFPLTRFAAATPVFENITNCGRY